MINMSIYIKENYWKYIVYLGVGVRASSSSFAEGHTKDFHRKIKKRRRILKKEETRERGERRIHLKSY